MQTVPNARAIGMQEANVFLLRGTLANDDVTDVFRSALDIDRVSVHDSADHLIGAIAEQQDEISLVILDSRAAEIDILESIEIINTVTDDSVALMVVVDDERAEIVDSLLDRGVRAILPVRSLTTPIIRIMARIALSTAKKSHSRVSEIASLRQEVLELRDNEKRLEEAGANAIEMAEHLHRAQQDMAVVNATKDRFFSIIAHDMKSPFTPILGFSQILMMSARDMPPGKIEEYAGMIHSAAESARMLLDDLLEWSRLHLGGGTTFEPQILNLEPCVSEHVQRYHLNAEGKGITLSNAVPGHLQAWADRAMTSTVLRNLISNAIKFTPQGGNIVIGGRVEESCVRIFVQDDGAGIEPERQAFLFRIDVNTSTESSSGEKGTGLGLPICKEMVDLQGGSISVDSSPGHGSTFSFTLPLPPVSAASRKH